MAASSMGSMGEAVMSDLIKLAERCEQATGPDRELECRIWIAFQPFDFQTARLVVEDLEQWVAPRYTASIDAALTLVPEGCLWELNQWANGASAECATTKPYEPQGRRAAATPALALCAAALRARASATERKSNS